MLTLGAPHFLLPGESLELNATLETYTGIPLQQQELKAGVRGVDGAPRRWSCRWVRRRARCRGSRTRGAGGRRSARPAGRAVACQELPFGSGDLQKLVPKLGDELKLKARGAWHSKACEGHGQRAYGGDAHRASMSGGFLVRNAEVQAVTTESGPMGPRFQEPQMLFTSFRMPTGPRRTPSKPMDPYRDSSSRCGPA